MKPVEAPKPKPYEVGDVVLFKEGDDLIKGTITGEENGAFVVAVELDGESVEYDVKAEEFIAQP